MHFTLLNSPFKALHSVLRFRVETLRNLEHSQRDSISDHKDLSADYEEQNYEIVRKPQQVEVKERL